MDKSLQGRVQRMECHPLASFGSSAISGDQNFGNGWRADPMLHVADEDKWASPLKTKPPPPPPLPWLTPSPCNRNTANIQRLLFQIILLGINYNIGLLVVGLRVEGLRVEGLRVEGLRVEGLRVVGFEVGWAVVGDSVAGELVVGDSVVGDSVVGESVVGDSVVGDSVVGSFVGI